VSRLLTHAPRCVLPARSKKLDLQRSGALIGSAMGGMHSFAGAVEAMTTQGHRKMNPFCIPFAITNMGGALAAMDIGFMVRRVTERRLQ
jgi:3-oxoacyl-(acyl-carrier-protein) synthase